MEDIFSSAIEYLRKNITNHVSFEDIVFDQATHQLNGTDINPNTIYQIEELMGEFYEENDLHRDQWKETADAEYIFTEYLDFRFYDPDGNKIYND